jgi:hypothetical protein
LYHAVEVAPPDVSMRVALVAPEIGVVHASEYHWYEKVVPPGSEAFAVKVMDEPTVVVPVFVTETEGVTLIHVPDTAVQLEL